MNDEMKNFFEKEVTIDTITRPILLKALLKRHKTSLKPLESELRDLKKKQKELDKQRELARKDRDKINEEVLHQKQRRQMHHQLANEKRREFFILIEKLDDLEKLDDEMEVYNNQLDELEWDLQTTRISPSDEKAMIKKMKLIYGQLTEVNKEAQERLGIQERLSILNKEIGDNLVEAQKHHEVLLKNAEESDQFHSRFVDSGTMLPEIRISIRRIERKLQNHKESIDYWNKWVGGDK